MKKCPKCGTVLDDSKKKCYMCGADLTASSSVSDFSSNFDERIGSSVTRGVDNVFNNGKDIDVDSSTIVGGKKNNNGSFFSHNSSSRDFFGGEINKLNSMTFDERSKPRKKINNLFGNKNLKSKDEINSKKQKDDNKSGKIKKISYSTNPNIPKKMQESIEESKIDNNKENNMFFPEKEEVKTIKSNLVKEEKEEVPEAFKAFNSFKNKNDKTSSDAEEINRTVKDNRENNEKLSLSIKGEQKNTKVKRNSAFAMFNESKKSTFYNNDNSVELEISDEKKDSSSNQTDFKGLSVPSNNPFDSLKRKSSFTKISSFQFKEVFRTVFNFTCVICFIVLLVFVYFHFIKTDSSDQLDGLQFKVPTYFKLNRKDSHEKFYVSKQLGNVCSFEVISGTVSDPNGYVENYFQYVKSLYASDKKAIPAMQEMKINGNTWKSEKFIFLPEDGKEVSSDTVIPRYTYTVITYNGSFYIVRATNKDEDKKCHEEYMKFVNSLEFIDSNVK